MLRSPRKLRRTVDPTQRLDAVPRVLLISLALSMLRFGAAHAAPALYTQTYSATTAVGTTLNAGNVATVTVARAAVRDTIPNDNGQSRAIPFAGSGAAMRCQLLIEKSQIGYGGVIDSIAWKLNDAMGSSVTFTDFTLKLAHTVYAHDGVPLPLSNAFIDNYDSAPVTVFGPASLTIPAHAAGDRLAFGLDDFFEYDDVRNLLVEVTWTGASPASDVATRVSDAAGGTWSVSANSSTATTGTIDAAAHFFVLHFVDDQRAVDVYDGSPQSVSSGEGSTYLYSASSSGSGATERWRAGDPLGGVVSNAAASRAYFDQFLPSVTLQGTHAFNTVATQAHTQLGVSVAAPGKYGTFSEWADAGSTLTFASTTSPFGSVTTDPRTFTVSSAFSATIHYVTVQTPLVKIVSLRADSADGSTHRPSPGAASPWVDLAGDHDASLVNFLGNASSGWVGQGVRASPYRLEFAAEDPGLNNRVAIPAGSVPELQDPGPVSTAVWFKTGFDGPLPRYEYLFEWVRHPGAPNDPATEGLGMSIAVQDGHLIVYLNPWVEVATVAPDTWYHVAVAKDADGTRIYLNGNRVVTNPTSHLGGQESEITLGCSAFRTFDGQVGEAKYGDFFSGSIAQAQIWTGALTDSAALAVYAADSAHYFPTPVAPVAPLITLRADSANGSTHYPIPGAGSPWIDLTGAPTNAVLGNFDGAPGSGWEGNGTPVSPYRLTYDYYDDHAAIPAGSAPEIDLAGAVSAAMWIHTGPDVETSHYRYVLEWLQGFGSSSGMSLAIANGQLQLYLGIPYWVDVAPVASNAWYHVVVTKGPGAVRVYVNGVLTYSGDRPNFGVPATEIVLGASTWRGPQNYGDHFDGSIAEFSLWQGAIADTQALALYRSGVSRFSTLAAVGDEAPFDLAMREIRPNPAFGPMTVSFTLPGHGRAEIDLIDVAGRRVRSVTLGELGAGPHAVTLRERSLASGVYWVRLRFEGQSVSRKIAVL